MSTYVFRVRKNTNLFHKCVLELVWTPNILYLMFQAWSNGISFASCRKCMINWLLKYPWKLNALLSSFRFAQFFLCPLFTKSATEREVNAVNSENLKNMMVDSRRYYQFQKSTGNPKHPYSKFGTGKCAPLDTNCSILFLIGLHSSFCALCSRQVPPNERSTLSIRKMRKIFQMIRGGCIN